MNLSTFLISLGIVAAILLIIRLFWPIIIAFFYLLNILWWSFLAAVIWAACVAQTSEGWVYTWMLIFLAFCGVFIVAYLIAIEAFGRFLTVLRKFVK